MKHLLYILISISLLSCGISKDLQKSKDDESYKNQTDSLLVILSKDSDNDGINDELDFCPNEFGFQENNGCPEVIKSIEKAEMQSNPIRKSENDKIFIKEEKSSNKPIKRENVKIEDKTLTNFVENNNETGIMAYSVPEEMKVGNTYNIKLRISKENNKVQLIKGDRNIPINDASVNSLITIESVRVEPIMSAQLISEESKFEISSSSTEVQNIEQKGYTEWQWFIKPLKGGDNFLKLVVKVRVKEDNQEFYKDITVFDKKISVKSNVVFSIKGFINQYWQWIMTTIIIPFVIWFYNRKKNEKKSSKK